MTLIWGDMGSKKMRELFGPDGIRGTVNIEPMTSERRSRW
jgi:phosphomannomutase